MEFENARKLAFEYIVKVEDVTILNSLQFNLKSHKQYIEIWEIKKQVSVFDIGKTLTFHLCFPNDFPLSLPSVYLSQESYNEIKYIPHVDTDYLICTYDNESVVTNPDDPAGIVVQCLLKARKIIQEGLEKKNHSDFIEEFLAYWENKYSKKDSVNPFVLSFIEKNPNNTSVKLLVLKEKIRSFEFILWQENPDSVRFKLFLDEKKIEYSEMEIFYVEENIIPEFPPFELTCRKTLELISNISEEKKEQIKSFLNNDSLKKFVLVNKQIKEMNHYLGWYYPAPQLLINGYRSGTIKPFDAFTKHQSMELVKRFSPVVYTTKRLQERTAGEELNTEYKFFIAGIGSVGSNLIHFLNALNSPEFRLVDNEILTIENTERHLLGFDKVNSSKVNAMREHLRMKNPKLEIKTKQESIINVCNEDLGFVNDSDFIFIVTGKSNIEKFIVEKLEKGEIIKPVFIIWVEPYLAGGHCIYIHPEKINHSVFYENFDGRNLFKYNIIDSSEYLNGNELLKMKEASCQTMFTPYSGASVVSFLSQLYSHILKLIKTKPKESISLTWVGDTGEIKAKGISLSEFANKKNSFHIIENIA